MFRSLFLFLLLVGCSAVLPDADAPVLATSDIRTSDADLLPSGYLEAVGPGQQAAVLAAQAVALRTADATRSVPWESKEASGTVAAGPLYMVNVLVCRDLKHEAVRSGERFFGRATLCRDQGGDWQRIS